MLFYDQKSTKMVYFGKDNKDHITLQALPLSFFDQEEAEMVDLRLDSVLKVETINKPDGQQEQITHYDRKKISIGYKELEYRRIAASIKEWSTSEPVTAENVKRLVKGVRDKLLGEIDKLNTLTEDEIKN